jgi:hypothetical protein
MWLNGTGDRMNVEWSQTSRRATGGGSADPPAPNIEHEIPAIVGDQVDEHAEQPAASAYQWRRRFIIANIIAWILIGLAVRTFFF